MLTFFHLTLYTYVKQINILSIDGGGMRGVIPAVILDQMTKMLRGRTRHKHLHEVFDLVAGTSTGGLLALGMTTPMTAHSQTSMKFSTQDLIDIYTQKGQLIFPKKGHKILQSSRQTIRNKYSATNFEHFLLELFGDLTSEHLHSNTILTAFDMQLMRPFLFRMYQEKNGQFKKWRLRDAARSTTAAPTFYRPAKIKSLAPMEKEYTLIDGGVCLNNPALIAYSEAKRLYPGNEYLIVSLGTGYSHRGWGYDAIKQWGFFQWMSPLRGTPLLNVMMAGQNASVLQTLPLFPDARFVRLNVDLGTKPIEMDDVRKNKIDSMVEMTYQMLDREKEMMERCFNWINEK